MGIRKFVSGALVGLLMLLVTSPARAGIPVIDSSNLAQQIQQVLAWGQQAQQMINQLQQMQTMTAKLDGARTLGTILNDPTIRSSLPAEMRDASQLLIDPAALAANPAQLNQILASFGVDTSTDPNAGRAQADTIARSQQILASSQARSAQLQALATRVDQTVDAKESLDMVNRNVLEAASINNQTMQAMAALEAARQSAELKRLADNQAFFARMKAGAAQPLRTFSY